MTMILSIAAGGALGAVMRHGAGVAALRLFGADFPWATMGVNIIGSFAMGVLIATFSHLWQPGADLKAFLTVGVLGGFTTFSAFSLDAVLLWERGQVLHASFYVGASVILSIAALATGLWIVRQVTV